MNRQEMVAALMQQGLTEAIAESLVKSMDKTVGKKTTRKNPSFFKEARVKGQFAVVVNCNCDSCKSAWTEKQVITCYEDQAADERHAVVRFCYNCIRELYELSKEELITLVVAAQHKDVEIRTASYNIHKRMAKKYSPQELYHLDRSK